MIAIIGGLSTLMPKSPSPSCMRPKQTDMIPGKGQFRSRFPNRLSYGCPTTIFLDPGTDTGIISAQHFWTGGQETGWAGCYDAVAIARAAGFPNAGYQPHRSCGDYPSEPATKSGQKYPEKSLSHNNHPLSYLADALGLRLGSSRGVRGPRRSLPG